MSRNPPPDDDLTGRLIDVRLHLTDRQVLDVGGLPVSVVDDVELSDVEVAGPIAPGTPPPTVTALLSGAVLATHIFGGRPPDSRLRRIAWSAVAEIGVAIRLAVRGDSLDVTWTERWVRDHIIAHIPGGRHDPR